MKLKLQGEFNPKMNETYIGLIDVSRIPFHLLVISGGKQFSWEVRKLRIGEPVESLLRHLKVCGVPACFLRISESSSTLEMAQRAYSCPEKEETCIGPIIKLVESIGYPLQQEPLTIFELMELFKKNGFNLNLFGLNLDAKEEIILTEYGRKEVDSHISELLATM